MTARESQNTGFGAVLGTIFRNKWKFLGMSVLAFLVCVWILGRLDLLPEPKNDNRVSTVTIAKADTFPSVDVEAVVENPSRIVIPSVGVDVEVLNPNTTNIYQLDQALLDGAVRYPTSGKLGENGNVVVFAHSSRLPVVKNQNFKAFNDIEDLTKGEIIEVYGADMVYKYAVERVYEADANDTRIPLTKDAKKLTLSTCNSFGNLDDRFVVEAYFVGSTQVSS